MEARTEATTVALVSRAHPFSIYRRSRTDGRRWEKAEEAPSAAAFRRVRRLASKTWDLANRPDRPRGDARAAPHRRPARTLPRRYATRARGTLKPHSTATNPESGTLSSPPMRASSSSSSSSPNRRRRRLRMSAAAAHGAALGYAGAKAQRAMFFLFVVSQQITVFLVIKQRGAPQRTTDSQGFIEARKRKT